MTLNTLSQGLDYRVSIERKKMVVMKLFFVKPFNFFFLQIANQMISKNEEVYAKEASLAVAKTIQVKTCSYLVLCHRLITFLIEILNQEGILLSG